MASVSLASPSSTIHTIYSPSLRSLCFYPSQNIPILSFYSSPKPSINFHSVSLGSQAPYKRRSFSVVVCSPKKLSETDPMVIPTDSEAVSSKFPADSCVFAVYNTAGDLQFIGISRNVAASVLIHQKSVPDLCSSIKGLRCPNFKAKASIGLPWLAWYVSTFLNTFDAAT